MRKLSFRQVYRELQKIGILLEKSTKVYDGEKYRYEVYETNGMTGVCRTLEEVWVEYLSY